MQSSREYVAKIRREYYRQWHAQHKNKVRDYNRRYWECKAERQKKEIKKDYDDSS